MAETGIVKTALVQQVFAGTPQRQRDKTSENIRACAEEGAELVILPELQNTAYFCQTEREDHFQLAETIPGPSTKYFGSLARKLGVVLVLSLFEKRARGMYHNTAVVMDKDGEIAGLYRKMHLPDDPGYYEKYYFTPGDTGYQPVKTSIGRLGVMVCWDQWYPEAARLMTLAGADMLVYPSAIGWDPRADAKKKREELEAWITVQRGHAIANGIPVVAVNRAGHEKDLSGQTAGIAFWGNSFACGPMGEVLCRAGEGEENIIVEIDKNKADKIRLEWPFLRDRRVDSYRDLIKIFL